MVRFHAPLRPSVVPNILCHRSEASDESSLKRALEPEFSPHHAWKRHYPCSSEQFANRRDSKVQAPFPDAFDHFPFEKTLATSFPLGERKGG